MGFCRGYSFNTGDLTTCGDVLLNYLEAYKSVPWDDLRYMFGEVSGAGCLSMAVLGLWHLTGFAWGSHPLGEFSTWSHLSCCLSLLQIFYGGHITDGMDRRCCMTYLQVGPGLCMASHSFDQQVLCTA